MAQPAEAVAGDTGDGVDGGHSSPLESPQQGGGGGGEAEGAAAAADENAAPPDIFWQGMNLSVACSQGRLGVVLMLWRMGADVRRSDRHGVTGLHHACYNGHLPIARFLVDKGADIDAQTVSKPQQQTDQKHTPLMWAVCAGHYDIVAFLIERGADQRVEDVRGYTMVVHAVHYDHADMVRWFGVAHGADLSHVDKAGHNTLQWAAYKGHLGTLRLLHEEFGVAHSMADHTQRTSLHWAAKEGHYRVVEYLLSKGASATAADSEGKTPADYAKENKAHYVVDLLNKGAAAAPLVAAGRAQSTFALLARDAVHRRTLLIAALMLSAVWLASTWTPVQLTYLLIPLAGTSPPILQSVVEGPLKAVSRPQTVKGQSHPLWFGQIWMQLVKPTDRNMGHFAFIIALQGVLPWFLLTGPVGAYAAAAHPFLLRVVHIAVAVAWLLWLRVVASSPRGPPDSLPAPDLERARCVPGTWDFLTMKRVPLRSAYCPFSQRVVCGYEYYSTALDSAVGDGNKVCVVAWELATAAWAAAAALLTFQWADAGAGGGATAAARYGACRVAWRLATSPLPAGSAAAPGRRFPGSLIPTAEERAAVWLFIVPSVVCLVALAHVCVQLYIWKNGYTFHDMTHVYRTGPKGEAVKHVPSERGLVAVNSGKGRRSIFSTGSAVRDLGGFLLGWGPRWSSMVVVRGDTAPPPPPPR